MGDTAEAPHRGTQRDVPVPPINGMAPASKREPRKRVRFRVRCRNSVRFMHWRGTPRLVFVRGRHPGPGRAHREAARFGESIPGQSFAAYAGGRSADQPTRAPAAPLHVARHPGPGALGNLAISDHPTTKSNLSRTRGSEHTVRCAMDTMRRPRPGIQEPYCLSHADEVGAGQSSRPMRPANSRTSPAYDGLARLTRVVTIPRTSCLYWKSCGHSRSAIFRCTKTAASFFRHS